MPVAALAGPVISVSRTLVNFGRINSGVKTSVQPVFVTNTGDAPLTVQALSVGGANATEFTVGGTCVVPVTLAPAGRCRIELVLLAGLGAFGSTRAAFLSIASNATSPAPSIGLVATLDNAPAYLGPPEPDPDWIDFSAQPVGTASATQTLTLHNVTGISLTITSAGLAGGNASDFALSTPCAVGGRFAPGSSCAFSIAFDPKASGPRSTEIQLVLSAFGVDAPFAYSITGVGGASAAPANYEGLWWASPPESESGWGINFAHQGDTIFATWFTYDATGKAWWLTMTAQKTTDGVYAGTLYQTRGPALDAVPFNPAAVTATPVGSAMLTFTNPDTAMFAYTVNGVAQAKTITRQRFGALPTCVFGALENLALATNYQDLWWAAPAGMESGWGVNFTHQGEVIFATWFTYDFDGAPLWLSATTPKTAPGVYSGTLYKTTGPPFNAVPFDPKRVTATPVGTLTITFADGNAATFRYAATLGAPPRAVEQSKAITRQVFRAPGTACS